MSVLLLVVIVCLFEKIVEMNGRMKEQSNGRNTRARFGQGVCFGGFACFGSSTDACTLVYPWHFLHCIPSSRTTKHIYRKHKLSSSILGLSLVKKVQHRNIIQVPPEFSGNSIWKSPFDQTTRTRLERFRKTSRTVHSSLEAFIITSTPSHPT